MPEPETWAALVPELDVTDLQVSLNFYTKLLGFEVVFDRPETHFAYLQIGAAQIMLDQIAEGAGWGGTGAREYPFGRGINLQIEVPALEHMLTRLANEGYPLYIEPEEKWYRTGTILSGAREFLVQDPDGYLLRFSEHLGEKPV